MIRPILEWPDPCLTQVCTRVGQIDDDIRSLANDMLETMYAAPGRGLAAPQVGVLKRLFVMDTAWKDGDRDPMVLIDPEINWASDETAEGPEGCLSIPDVTVMVRRSQSVRMSWCDLRGDRQSATFDGFAAVCSQHELDHLNGTVTFDRLDAETRADIEPGYLTGRPQ